MSKPSFFLRSATLAAAAVLAACSTIDAPPTAPAAGAPTAGPRLATIATAGDTTVTTFVYQPQTGLTQQLGQHKLVMPARSVCDPLTSSYGVSEWDKPCAPAQLPVVITAKSWTNADGRAQVDFSPELRFVPTQDSRGFVKLFFQDKAASDAALAEQLRIDWVPYVGATPVNEYATDPTLRTVLNTSAGMAWRQLKHFSGYTLAVGRSGEME